MLGVEGEVVVHEGGNGEVAAEEGEAQWACAIGGNLRAGEPRAGLHAWPQQRGKPGGGRRSPVVVPLIHAALHLQLPARRLLKRPGVQLHGVVHRASQE